MKSLLTLPVLMLLLTACGSTPPGSVPEAVDSTETVEAALCNTVCPHVSFYYCDPGAYHCGPCIAHNAIACFPIPASGNYGLCGGSCSGGHVTQYHKQTNCDVAGTPNLGVTCFKPSPSDTSFSACGQLCPQGFSLGASWFEPQCDSVCVMSGGACANTGDNAMRCDRIP